VGGLTAAELTTIRGRLEAFADDVFASLPRADQRARGQCYLRGLMLDGRRKSIEPMAQRLGEVHYPALHHFVTASPWDWRPVRRRLAEALTAALEPTAWVVDDTGSPKDGPHSVGCSASTPARWARPPTASWGCRSTRSPTRPAVRWAGGCSSPSAATRGQWPSGAWPATCPRTSTTGPGGSWCWTCWMSWPAGTLAGWDLRRPVLLADSGYGEVGEFRAGLDARQVPYVVEVQAATSAYPEQVRPTVAPHKGRGRRPRTRYRDQPSSLKELAMADGQQACVGLIWRRGSKGLHRSRFLALRVPPGRGHATPTGTPGRRGAAGALAPGRMALRQGRADQVLAGQLPQATPLVELVGLARSRWRVEQDYRELKGGLGWTTSRVVAGPAGTTTSRWSRSRMASSPWSGCDAQDRRRRPDPVAAAQPTAGPACLLGRRLSGVQASRAMVATPNGTTTRPDLTVRLVVRLPTQSGSTGLARRSPEQ
jgi:SRSO17 transposase